MSKFRKDQYIRVLNKPGVIERAAGKIGKIYLVAQDGFVFANFDGNNTGTNNGCFSPDDIEAVDFLNEKERRLIETLRVLSKNDCITIVRSDLEDILKIVDRLAPNPGPIVKDNCDGKIVEIDGRKYKLTII